MMSNPPADESILYAIPLLIPVHIPANNALVSIPPWSLTYSASAVKSSPFNVLVNKKTHPTFNNVKIANLTPTP